MIRRLTLFTALGLAVYALLFRKRERVVSMHEDDWAGRLPGEPRRYKSPGHALHHLQELIPLTPALARVYLARAITPSFREQIMIVTAMANACPS